MNNNQPAAQGPPCCDRCRRPAGFMLYGWCANCLAVAKAELEAATRHSAEGGELGVSADVARRLLELREVIARMESSELQGEAWHILYSIANPAFDSLRPWVQLEARATTPADERPLRRKRMTNDVRCQHCGNEFELELSPPIPRGTMCIRCFEAGHEGSREACLVCADERAQEERCVDQKKD